VAGSTEGVVVARRAWQLTLEMHFLVQRTSENSVSAKFVEFVFHEIREVLPPSWCPAVRPSKKFSYSCPRSP
jgi:hypothetical protein